MCGIVILLVLFNYVGVFGLDGGFVGVDVFFVILGYFIGGLLFREFEVIGGLDFWVFYV